MRPKKSREAKAGALNNSREEEEKKGVSHTNKGVPTSMKVEKKVKSNKNDRQEVREKEIMVAYKEG